MYQKDRTVLDGICAFVSCGNVQEYTNRNGEPMHCWVVGGAKAFQVAEELLCRSHCLEKCESLREHVLRVHEGVSTRAWMNAHPEAVATLKAAKGGVLF